MANPRLLDKRRRSIKNIRKITRTMELIATARFKKAMDRASAATAYTVRMTKLVQHLLASGLQVSHPLLEKRESVRNVTLLVLTANRGLCGGFNGNLQRAGYHRWLELKQSVPNCRLEVVGKRGISAFKFRGITPDAAYTKFEGMSRQHVSIETLLPLGAISGDTSPAKTTTDTSRRRAIYEFLPSPE